MLKNKKILVGLVVLIVVVGVGYTMVKPKASANAKIPGTIYVLPQSFLLNLQGGHYAKLTVALELAPGQSAGTASASSGSSSGSEEVTGTLPEEAAVRAIVTNQLTNQRASNLMDEHDRQRIKRRLLAAIQQQTDVKVDEVLFPDLTVQ